MNSCVFSTECRRQALRAALVALVAFTGCQGSLRSWRRDEPSLRELVVASQRQDEANARLAPDSDYPNRPAPNRSSKSTKGGRSNPYATGAYGSKSSDRRYDQTAENSANDDETLQFEVEDAEFKAMLSKTDDPAHRTMLIQIYKAMQARRAQQAEYADDEYGDDEQDEYEADQAPERSAPSRNPSQFAQSNARSRRQPAQEASAAVYHLRDTDDEAQYDEDDRASYVQQASATRELPTDQPLTDKLGNRIEREPVHYKMSDESDAAMDSAENFNMQPRQGYANAPTVNAGQAPKKNTKAKSKPQELAPPKSHGSSRKVNEPVVNTGYTEEIPGMRRGGPREEDTSSRKQSPANFNTASKTDPNDIQQSRAQQSHHDEVSSPHFTADRGAVVTASANSATIPETYVQPASANASRADAMQPASSAVVDSNSTLHSQPADASATQDDWRELAHKALRSLEQEQLDGSLNAQLNHHVTKRVLYVLLGELNQALDPIPGLQPHEQEYFRHNLQALHNSIDPRGNPVLARRWPLVMDNHRLAMSHLGAISNLEVKNAAFCSHVDGYGVITRFPNNRFRPNQEVLLYCEVDNFVSEQIKDGYETKLRGSYEIVDANQTRVEDVLLPEEVDICKRPRRDYFFVYRIYTPKTIAPGRYQLRLSIEDAKANKWGQTSLDLEIVSQ